MSVLDKILRELDESYIVEHITKKHDEARIQYHLRSNTVSGDTEFDTLIADYYNHHFKRCIASGGALSRAEAGGRAKEIIEREYRKRGQDKLHAYSNGKNGYDGGMRAILDIIMENLKQEAVERHIRDVLDRYVAPSSFKEQVAIVKDLISRTGSSSAYVDAAHPERYARNYEELIRGLVDSIKAQAAKFRRL
jgi:hypothetical protein